MALQICTECHTAYAPAGECPHCGANHWVDETTAEERDWYSTNGDSLPDDADGSEPAGEPTEPETEGKSVPDGSGAASVPFSAPEDAPPAPDHAEVRAWAKDQGLDVADAGPVPGWVVQSYNEQHK